MFYAGVSVWLQNLQNLFMLIEFYSSVFVCVARRNIRIVLMNGKMFKQKNIVVSCGTGWGQVILHHSGSSPKQILTTFVSVFD
jgi:hypothetical protein